MDNQEKLNQDYSNLCARVGDFFFRREKLAAELRAVDQALSEGMRVRDDLESKLAALAQAPKLEAVVDGNGAV